MAEKTFFVIGGFVCENCETWISIRYAHDDTVKLKVNDKVVLYQVDDAITCPECGVDVRDIVMLAIENE